jgi:hypothetical protein
VIREIANAALKSLSRDFHALFADRAGIDPAGSAVAGIAVAGLLLDPLGAVVNR